MRPRVLEYVGAFLEPTIARNPCASSSGWPLSSSIRTFFRAPTRYLEFQRRKLGRLVAMLWTVNKTSSSPRCFDRPLPLVLLPLPRLIWTVICFSSTASSTKSPCSIERSVFSTRSARLLLPYKPLTPEPFTFTKLLALLAICL